MKAIVLSLICIFAQCRTSLAADNEGKRLFLLAGPHRTGSTSMQAFLHRNGRHHASRSTVTFALRSWDWPLTTESVMETYHQSHPGVEEEDYKIWAALVEDESSSSVELMESLYETLKITWEQSQKGMVVGTEAFDQLPRAKGQGPNALKAIKSLVEYLEIKPEQVTVVINYRSPRLEHYQSVWKANGTSYTDFVCAPERAYDLDTQLHPLHMADVYVQKGYQVKLIDMAGVLQKELDISHAFVCQVLGAKCVDGWLKNHESETYHLAEGSTNESWPLDEHDSNLIGDMLQARDCHFRYLTEKKNFEVIYPSQDLWKNCPASKNSLYSKLASNSDILHLGLQSQVECETQSRFSLTPSDILAEKIPKALAKSDGSSVSGPSIAWELILMPLILASSLGYQVYRVKKTKAVSSVRVETELTSFRDDDQLSDEEMDGFSDEVHED